MWWLKSLFSLISSGARGLVKLGQPQPASNLSRELNSGAPEIMST